MKETKYDLIKFEDGEFSLDVNVSPLEDTVWLTQSEMALLFGKARNTISEHIVTIFKEMELDETSVCRYFRHTAKDGKEYKVKYYNLDMIISVGYRVNSKRGIQFRRWATSILKQYLIKGISINEKRCLAHSDSLIEMNQQLSSYNLRLTSVEEKIDFLTNTDTIWNNKLFYEDQVYDAYSYIKQLFTSAKDSITLIDGYVDLSVLNMLVGISLPITIYTYPSASLSNQDIEKFSIQHGLTVIKTNKIHDRFIIIDDSIYLCGSSIKDVGKKRFVLTRLESITQADLLNNIERE
ncbi:MAG: virulence RhuM family protein [Anaeroplasmataceae bacterium]|nr:virulence RhuM family protein [Anaeroplasmataceae bacterium]